MKTWLKKIGGIFLTATLFVGSFGAQPVLAKSTDFRGVWISTVYSADYPSTQNNAAAQKKEFTQKLDQLKEMGFNAVLVQVRPKGDAFYQSDLNPWSEILTGTQGKDPGYDPMAFMIEETHKRGMEFHAWMNPYRITTSGADLAQLSADNMARKHPDWILTYNNAMYYNPEKAEVKEYIAATVKEIVENYNVDGIHFDDYFYPSNYPLPDGESRDGQVANSRRTHVNDMIQMVSKTIKSANSKVEFGISPMGVWKNNSSDPAGSATKGSEGYYAVYGDAKAWVDKGLVDYIAPQIYWEKGNQYCDYETLVKWWSNLVRGTGVRLYIGQGIYKDSVAKEIAAEMKINEGYSVDGSIFFSLRDLLNDRQGCAGAMKQYYGALQGTPVAPESPTEPQPPRVIEKKKAYAARPSITVNSAPVAFETYIIDDYTYLKLRDIAHAISGTEKQFNTVWSQEENAIMLLTGTAYTGTASAGKAAQDTSAVTSTAKLYLDGTQESVSAFTINDYTYYKLRDIAKLIDFKVTWNEAAFRTEIDTAEGF